MSQVEPPGEEPFECVLGRSRRRSLLERADHGHPDRTGVEPLRVRADDVALDPAVAAFVDRAEAVDEEVVADVVPAVPLHVEEWIPRTIAAASARV